MEKHRLFELVIGQNIRIKKNNEKVIIIKKEKKHTRVM